MRVVNVSILGLILLGLLSFSSCREEVEPDPNIVELAMKTPELSTLVEALQLADLTVALEGVGAKTVFAPTNTAFQALLDSNPAWTTLEDIDKETLQQVLLFHVISDEVKAADLTDTYVKTLAAGPNDEAISLQITVTGGVKFNGSAVPSTTDIEATNGTIHIINEVMLPPNVVDLAINNSDFSILVSALTRADLTTDFVSILTGDGPFTIFAPTNAAFEALLNSNAEWNSLDDIPVETLEAVLTYHVVSGANVQSDELTDDQEISTIGGKLMTDLSSSAKLETSSNQSVDIVLTDVQGTNGVIHVVDEVLLP